MSETMMTMITASFSKEKGVHEISRRDVKVVKKGRWLIAGMYSFDTKTLKETQASRSSGYTHRLERKGE